MKNVSEGIVYNQPKTETERAEVAAACMLRVNLRMPMLLDHMSNEVDDAYAAWPDRLFVVDRKGIISWRSDQGPFGFDLESWEQAIRAELPTSD